MPTDAQAALRLWDEANALLLSCLSDVVSGRTPSPGRAEREDRHVKLNRLSRRLARHLTAVYDQLGIDGEPPSLALYYGVLEDKPLLWNMSNPWMSLWAESPMSEWRMVRQNLALGADGDALLRHQQGHAEKGHRWLEAVVAGPTEARPPLPTAAYCLLPAYRVRWEGETELQPQLWHILKYLLSRDDYPCPVDGLEEAVWRDEGVTAKTVQNRVLDLNTALLRVRFPCEYHVRKAHVHRD